MVALMKQIRSHFSFSNGLLGGMGMFLYGMEMMSEE
ncbi:MAG: hypothetical protein Ct9H90mP20_1850 [Candidatus Neomarinimicrobiota bacterium]|nr:MAG: hypothetical protein Ct9H90mP20_1850 [Candidatus Neomarinimicrobiota bacterium]